MAEKKTTRIDKWIWAVRIYKTRTMAKEACTGRKVKIDNKTVKASRMIQQGDIVQIRKGFIKYEYKVLKIAEKRMGAKIVPNFMKDVTSEDELAKLKASKSMYSKTRKKGEGRPTKKERRHMDKFREKY